MTYFLVYTEDKADSLSIRQTNRTAHLEWLRSDPNIELISAGPWLDDDEVMRGSLLIVKAADLKTVENWLNQDPYKLAGLTGFKRIRKYNWAIGAPE